MHLSWLIHLWGGDGGLEGLNYNCKHTHTLHHPDQTVITSLFHLSQWWRTRLSARIDYTHTYSMRYLIPEHVLFSSRPIMLVTQNYQHYYDLFDLLTWLWPFANWININSTDRYGGDGDKTHRECTLFAPTQCALQSLLHVKANRSEESTMSLCVISHSGTQEHETLTLPSQGSNFYTSSWLNYCTLVASKRSWLSCGLRWCSSFIILSVWIYCTVHVWLFSSI